MIKGLFFLFCLGLSLLITPLKVQAQNKTDTQQAEFATSYDVTLDVGEDGITTVTEKISLKNLTSQYYANQFKLTIGATRISDVKASDPSGPLEVQTQQQDSSTVISVKFNQQVAGINKVLPWTLQFKSSDFAQKQGKVWEVTTPKIAATTHLENYNLTISVPVGFGEPTLISPIPKSQTVSFNKRFLTFDKEQIKNSGVSASFGNYQLFDFDLTYRLENPRLFPVVTNIALPPDTAYQDVIFQRLDPEPVNVTVDEDGNYLAWYRLNRNQKLEVKAIGSAKLYTTSKVKNPTLTSALRDKYTSASKFWEKDNPVIQNKLQEILGSTPPDSNREKARLIFRYVVDSLKYDSSRLNSNTERFGAVTALNHPDSAVCMEFTDLFLALARAAGIPARELDGYAHTSNTTLRPLSLTRDILHSWPEYWDELKGWVMVDPTWENTTGGVDYFNKLDLNHFVLVVKGLSSQQPIPAGFYKYKGQEETNDVKVVLSENDFLGKPQLNVEIEKASPILAGLPNRVQVIVKNRGNGLYQSAPILVQMGKTQIAQTGNAQTGPIPPFGHSQFDYEVKTKSLFDSYDDTMQIEIGNQKFTKQVSIRPIVPLNFLLAAVAALIVIIFGIYLTILARFIYRKRSGKVESKA